MLLGLLHTFAQMQMATTSTLEISCPIIVHIVEVTKVWPFQRTEGIRATFGQLLPLR